MSFLKIDDLNEIYFEYIKPKKNGYTFVFVNALTGNVDTWNNEIANIITDNGNGYLAYNFRGQEKSKFDESLILDTTLIVSDLCFLLDHIQPENIILVGLSIGGLYASLALPKVKDCKRIGNSLNVVAS
jgi:pimeloyl-ACP methyl ester carboxylesterase